MLNLQACAGSFCDILLLREIMDFLCFGLQINFQPKKSRPKGGSLQWYFPEMN